MPEYQRTMGYSTAYAFCALGLFLGVGMAITLGIFIDLYSMQSSLCNVTGYR